MKKKGFTLVELLLTIVIIALLGTVSIIGYRFVFSNAENKYYTAIENNMLLAGNDYFEDHREALPIGNDYSEVLLDDLVESKYIESIKDANGNICTSGAVYVYRENDKYKYEACIKCGEYSSSGKYCDNKVSKVIVITSKKKGNTTNDYYDVLKSFNSQVYSNGQNILVTATMDNLYPVVKYVAVNTKNSTYNPSCLVSSDNSCTIEIEKTGTYRVVAYDSDNKEISSKYINVKIAKGKPEFSLNMDNKYLINKDDCTSGNKLKEITIDIIKQTNEDYESVKYQIIKHNKNEDISSELKEPRGLKITEKLESGHYTIDVIVKNYSDDNEKMLSRDFDITYLIDIEYDDDHTTITHEVVKGQVYNFLSSLPLTKTSFGQDVTIKWYKNNYLIDPNVTTVDDDCTHIIVGKTSIPVNVENFTNYCVSNLKYTGSELTLTTNPPTNVTFIDNKATAVGSHTIKAHVETPYIWSDGTIVDKTFNCSIGNGDNPITVTSIQSISATFATSNQNKTFTAATNAEGSVTYTIQSQKNSSGTTVSLFSIPTNTTASIRIAANTTPGTYTVVVRATAAGNTNYNSGYQDITLTVTISKASNPITVTTPQSISVFSREIVQTSTLTGATNGEGSVTYTIQSQKNSSGTSVSQFTLSGTTLTTKANTAVGTYTVVVRATAAGNSNYNSGYKDITVNVTVKKPILYDIMKEKINTSSCSSSWVDNMDTTSTSDDVTYLSGRTDCVTFNYLWYSGRLWRVIALYPDGTIKLTTENNLTTIYWGSSIEYKNSWIYQWLNEDFYDTLYNVSNVVVSHTWNYSTIDRTNIVRPTSVSPQKTVSAKVGLLNAYEYKKIKYYLSINASSWLLSPASSSTVTYADNKGSSGIYDYAPNVYEVGVRPAVVIKSGLEVTGEGTVNNPFKLKVDKAAPTVNSTLLNTRSVGEYVKFNNEIYRIVEIQNSTTKLVKVDPLKDSSNAVINKKISSTYYGSSAATQSNDYWDYYLNNTWYNSLSSTSKNMMVNGTYYLGVYGSAGVHYKKTICKNSNLDSVTVKNCTKYTSSDANMTYTGKVGLSRVGEMFSAFMDTTSTTYAPIYLITPYSVNGKIYIYIDKHTKLGSSSSEYAARPTINIKSTIKITGGTGYVGGSTNSPYTIG